MKIKKHFALLFAVMMVLVLSTNTLAAASYDEATENIYLGTLADDEGFNPVNADIGNTPVPTGGIESLEFSFRAAEVYDLLTTKSSNKKINTFASSDDYIVRGHPHFDPRPSVLGVCRAGLCYYDVNAGIYQTSPYLSADDFSDEYGGEKYIDAGNMVSYIDYYGFCKNLMNEGGTNTYAMRGTFYVYSINPY